MKKKLFSLGVLILTLILVTVLSSAPKSADAAKSVFGGRLFIPTGPYCSASCGYAGFTYVIVGPPKGGAFIVTPATKRYSKGRIQTGSWVLGDYSPGGSCSMRVGKYCVPVQSQGYITQIGTS
jgi:hypothetical protein